MVRDSLEISKFLDLDKEDSPLAKVRILSIYKEVQNFEIGTVKGLCQIHHFIYEKHSPFAGQIRTINIAKEGFRFVPVLYLEFALQAINKMPVCGFDSIVEKYIEMEIAHPFVQGNERCLRIWLDLLLQNSIKRVVSWNKLDKKEYKKILFQGYFNPKSLRDFLYQHLSEDVYNIKRIYSLIELDDLTAT